MEVKTSTFTASHGVMTAEAGVISGELELCTACREDGTLTLSGSRSLAREEKKEGYHRLERSFGTFSRSFTLPPTVDSERIRAENRNGVLSIFLPRREETKPRKIEVKVHH